MLTEQHRIVLAQLMTEKAALEHAGQTIRQQEIPMDETRIAHMAQRHGIQAELEIVHKQIAALTEVAIAHASDMAKAVPDPIVVPEAEEVTE